MASIWKSLAALLMAGSLLISGPLELTAPQNTAGDLMLGNRQWLLSEYYVPEIRSAQVPGQVRGMQDHAAAALEEMFAACKQEAKVTLTSVSGYRSYDKQVIIYNRKLKNVKGDVAKADQYVARPGASEHQTGLTIDIGQKNKESSNLGASFGRTAGGKWIRENAWRFGFILRYDQGWEDITGYAYEPWHIRYVGKEYARQIHEQGIPLETFLLILREATILDIVSVD